MLRENPLKKRFRHTGILRFDVETHPVNSKCLLAGNRMFHANIRTRHQSIYVAGIVEITEKLFFVGMRGLELNPNTGFFMFLIDTKQRCDVSFRNTVLSDYSDLFILISNADNFLQPIDFELKLPHVRPRAGMPVPRGENRRLP